MDWKEMMKENSKQAFKMKNIRKLKPNRERQILLGITYMWNRKKNKKSQTQRNREQNGD